MMDLAALKRGCRAEELQDRGPMKKSQWLTSTATASHRLTLMCSLPTVPMPKSRRMQVTNVMGGDIIKRPPITSEHHQPVALKTSGGVP